MRYALRVGVAIPRSAFCAVMLFAGCWSRSEVKSGAASESGGSGASGDTTAGAASGASGISSSTASGESDGGTSGSEDAVASCPSNAPLSGATYDITKSRFAFGSTPSKQNTGSLVRWVGSDGAIAISSDGSEEGELNGGAPEANLPDWSTDPT